MDQSKAIRCYNLALMHLKSGDTESAMKWLKKAADEGHEESKEKLAELSKVTKKPDMAKALELDLKENKGRPQGGRIKSIRTTGNIEKPKDIPLNMGGKEEEETFVQTKILNTRSRPQRTVSARGAAKATEDTVDERRLHKSKEDFEEETDAAQDNKTSKTKKKSKGGLLPVAIVVLVIILAGAACFYVFDPLNMFNKEPAAEGDIGNDWNTDYLNSESLISPEILEAYSQALLTGEDVLAVLDLFLAEPYAIIVNTLKNTANSCTNYAALLAAEEELNFIDMNSYNIHNLTVMGTNEYVTTYQFIFEDEQNIEVDQATEPTNEDYINPEAEFISVLIYDEFDVVVGIYIEELITEAAWVEAGGFNQSDFLLQGKK